MKYIAKMHLAFNKAIENIKNNKGQNTVEYLFMLLVIVGVVGLISIAIKQFMPELFEKIKASIMGQASNI